MASIVTNCCTATTKKTPEKRNEVSKMKEPKYMNQFTGELYYNIWHAITSVVADMIYFKSCRTVEMLHITRWHG